MARLGRTGREWRWEKKRPSSIIAIAVPLSKKKFAAKLRRSPEKLAENSFARELNCLLDFLSHLRQYWNTINLLLAAILNS